MLFVPKALAGTGVPLVRLGSGGDIESLTQSLLAAIYARRRYGKAGLTAFSGQYRSQS
jgi:hypothetical protein